MEPNPHQDSAPAEAGAKQRLLHSTVSAYGTLFVRLIIAFGTRIILARLILPEGHGAYEQALRVVMMLSAVRDLGLTHHLMRDPRESYGTVLAWSLGAGAVLSLALVAAADLFSYLPDLPSVLRAMAVWIVIDAVIMVYRTFFERKLLIRDIAGFEVLRALLFGAVAALLALNGAAVWSFVGGELAASAVFALLLLRRARGRVPLYLDMRRIPGLLKASRYLFVVWVAFQVFNYVDPFIVEFFSTTAFVGYYAQAYWLAFLVPLTLTVRPLLPALVEFRDDPAEFAETLRLGTIVFLSGIVVSAYFLFFNVEKVVLLLFGPNWVDVGPLLRVLCLVPLVDVFTTTGGEALKVLNRDRLWLTTVVLNMAALIAFGVVFAYHWGPIGMAWANFARLGSLLMLVKVLGLFAGRRRRLAGNLAQVYLLPLPFFAAAAWLLPAGSWERFAGSLAAAALGGGLLALRFLRDYRRFFLATGSGSAAGLPASAGPAEDAGAAGDAEDVRRSAAGRDGRPGGGPAR